MNNSLKYMSGLLDEWIIGLVDWPKRTINISLLVERDLSQLAAFRQARSCDKTPAALNCGALRIETIRVPHGFVQSGRDWWIRGPAARKSPTHLSTNPSIHQSSRRAGPS